MLLKQFKDDLGLEANTEILEKCYTVSLKFKRLEKVNNREIFILEQETKLFLYRNGIKISYIEIKLL